MTNLALQVKDLDHYLKQFPALCLAFSGGVDSSYLAYAAQQALGSEAVLAVIIDSDLSSGEECQSAIDIAEGLGLTYRVVEVKELEDERIRQNDEQVWYYSKLIFYQALEKMAQDFHPQAQLIDGMNADDLDDWRPGLKARSEFDVKSPLIEAAFSKEDVRQAAKEAGLDVWNKPSGCSVISRFPRGIAMTTKAVEQVLACESALLASGYQPCRVRYYGDLAKVEVAPEQIPDFIKEKEKLLKVFQDQGFKHLALDVEGYRYGKLNR